MTTLEIWGGVLATTVTVFFSWALYVLAAHFREERRNRAQATNQDAQQQQSKTPTTENRPGKFRQWIARQFKENGRAIGGRAFLFITLPTLYFVKEGWWFIVLTLAGFVAYVYFVAKDAQGRHYNSFFGWLFEEGKKKRLAGVAFSYAVLVLAEVCGGQLTWVLQQTPARGLFGVFLLAIFYLVFAEVFSEETFVKFAKNSFVGYVTYASAGLLMIILGWFGREYFRSYWLAALFFAGTLLWWGRGIFRKPAEKKETPSGSVAERTELLDGRRLRGMAFGAGMVILGSMLATFFVDHQPFADSIWERIKKQTKTRVEETLSGSPKSAEIPQSASEPVPASAQPAARASLPAETPHGVSEEPAVELAHAAEENPHGKYEDTEVQASDVPQQTSQKDSSREQSQAQPEYDSSALAPSPVSTPVPVHRKAKLTIMYGVRTLNPLSRLDTCTEGMRLANACK